MVSLGLILGVFFLLQSQLGLRDTVILGADEGFELAKAILCLHGYHLYSDIWNDQPPLLTFLVTGILKHVTLSALGPRLLTGLFSGILLTSLFCLGVCLDGWLVGTLTAVFFLASPGFLVLGSSCMLEVPALATAAAALAVLVVGRRATWRHSEVWAGILFGISLETKLINIILLPLAAGIVYFDDGGLRQSWRHVGRSVLVLSVSIILSVALVDYMASGGAYLAHFSTSWKSHFGGVKVFNHGSPGDHPFDWSAVLKNWDVAIPAAAGVAASFRRRSQDALRLLPVAWLGLSFVVFGVHRPWWHYYIVHTSVPLCWCAAIGLGWVFDVARARKSPILMGVLGVYFICAAAWMSARVYLQIEETRRSPHTYACLFLKEIADLQPQPKWIYCEEPVYSFHTGIPMPPDLAVVMLKRYWSGEITDDRIAADLTQYQPGIILLRNDSRQRPFHQLLDGNYHLIYMDNDHLVYQHNAPAARPGASRI